MPKTKVTFEQALDRLGEIVSQLEAGDVPLEDSLKSFEEGKKLIKQCLSLLDAAEKKVKQLEETPEGNFELTNFS